jgi:hypothetical protein
MEMEWVGNYDEVPLVEAPITPVYGNYPFHINFHSINDTDQFVNRNEFQQYDPKFPIAWDGFMESLTAGTDQLTYQGCPSCSGGLGAMGDPKTPSGKTPKPTQTPPAPVTTTLEMPVLGSTQELVLGIAAVAVVGAAALWLYKSGKKKAPDAAK